MFVGVPELLRLQRRLSDEWDGLKPAPQILPQAGHPPSVGAFAGGRGDTERHSSHLRCRREDSERYSLIVWFGTHPERERKQPDVELLNDAATRELEEDVRARLRLKGFDELKNEDDFPWLVLHAYGIDADGRCKLDELADDDSALALLRTCIAMSVDGFSRFHLEKAECYFERSSLERRIEKLCAMDLPERDREILGMAKEAITEPSAA